MYLPDIAGAVRRQWYLVFVGILLTAAVGSQAVHTRDRYLASEVLVIQPPVSSFAPNPMTGLYPSMAVTAAAMASRLNTPDAHEMFRSLGVTGTYSFEPRNTGTNQEPRYVIASLTITNIAGDKDGSVRELGVLKDAFETELKNLQDSWNVAKGLRIAVAVLVPATATLLLHSPVRSLIGVALLGAVGTAAVLLWADEAGRRRRRRSAEFALSGTASTR
jgi:hypothetical protein